MTFIKNLRRWRWTVAVLAGLALSGVIRAAGPTTSPTQPWPAKSDRAAILRELSDVTAAGFDHRFGPDYAAYHATPEKLPEIYLIATKQDNGGRPYQLGGPWNPKKAGDFSSTQGQILYVPSGDTFPVDRVTISEWTNGTYSEKPEEPWHGGSRPEPASKKWLQASNGKPGMPVCIGRGYGGWANCSVIVFSSGMISAAGTVTARGLEPVIQLPPNKVPTAISVTNKNEFALVTVCDTETHKGQVAVISIGVNGKKMKFVHEWQDDAWSLPNVAMITDLKLLGFVDLPGIEFPTSICAVGNHTGGRMNGRDGNAGILREYDLAKQADRDVFLKGSNAHFGDTTGFAVVAGKYEGKAAFLDLQALFHGVREMYFTTEENYQKTRDSGPGPKQWPYTFDGEPTWRPTVVATIDVPQPTAVLASLDGGETKARAFIASLDGSVGVYSVGGLASEDAASPRDIARLFDVQAGHNPTCLTYQKGSHDTIIACSRGDRKISWIKYATQGAQVMRELRDERLIDPVQLEQADTHGIETSLLTVADFHGHKIINYRWSEARFATQGGARFGMGPDGKDEFECGGLMEFPGAPFCISASNVN